MAPRSLLSAPRPRRIVSRAVMVLSVVVLLPVLYVTGGASLAFLDAAGWFPRSAVPIAGEVYRPLEWYVRYDRPGSETIRKMFDAAKNAGRRIAD